MPKQTFLNLNEQKKKRITDAFLREFAIKYFDEASITTVVKSLGIAKGSIYQYFEDKLDLFMYLVEECTKVKLKYMLSLKRENYADYWAYFRDLFVYGFQFDAENPLQSHFLHKLTQNLNSPSVKTLYNDLMKQSAMGFQQMAAYEVEHGFFRADIPIETMGFMLYKVGVGIQQQLEISGVINPQESIQKNLPVYQGKKKLLLKTVDDYIKLVKPAFDK